MNIKYQKTSLEIGKTITRCYSQSFFIATSILEKEQKEDIYALYGFIRLIDEVADASSEFDRKALFNRLESDYKSCFRWKVSLNPIIYGLYLVQQKRGIPFYLVEELIENMRYKILSSHHEISYDIEQRANGVAENIAQMCLYILLPEESTHQQELHDSAKALGIALQKINLLRNVYRNIPSTNLYLFREVDLSQATELHKQRLISEIEKELELASYGISQLPGAGYYAVMTVFNYFSSLLLKIKNTPMEQLQEKRLKLSEASKAKILTNTFLSRRKRA